MIYHVNQSPGDGTICRIQGYEIGAEPVLLPGWVRMTSEEFLAWFSPLSATKASSEAIVATAKSESESAANLADLSRETYARSIVSQLEANLDTDPGNLAQVSNQLRWLKRIALFLLKRELRNGQP